MIDFKTLNVGADGLVPAIVQDRNTLQVLMLGYMNAEALEKTQASGLVTFFSRSRQTCWGDAVPTSLGFIRELESVIKGRHEQMPEKSYTTSLFKAGTPRMAQKVGEEAVETVIEAVKGDDERMIYEASDLVYHLLVLLVSKGYGIADLEKELEKRHK